MFLQLPQAFIFCFILKYAYRINCCGLSRIYTLHWSKAKIIFYILLMAGCLAAIFCLICLLFYSLQTKGIYFKKLSAAAALSSIAGQQKIIKMGL